MMETTDTEKPKKRNTQDYADEYFVLDENQNEPEASVESSHAEITMEMKAYVNALKENKNKLSALVHDLIETTTDESQEHPNGTFVWEKTSGKPSVLACGEPMTVDTPRMINDIAHVIKDTFRDHLCRDLPGNKRKLFDSPELEEHLSLIEDIRRAEKDVMEVQERLLRSGNDNGRTGLKPRNVKNYSLLMLGDDNEKKESVLNDNHNEQTTVYGIHDELRRLRLRLNKERPKLNIKYSVPTARQCCAVSEQPEDAVRLSVNVNTVRFNRFRLGAVFKKTITVTNAGTRMASFRILSRSNSINEVFRYDYTRGRPLAPGMNAKVAVTFNCASMADEYELMSIITKDNRRTNVIVCAENEIPILKYVFGSYDMTPVFEYQTRRRLGSAVCVFECNACLVGATKTVAVSVKNIGRSAKFICVPEDVWYTQSVGNVEWTNTMVLDAFHITPSIFEIDYGQWITLNVTFVPRSPTFFCSRFIIVSDNSCAHEANVFGDGQTFCRRAVRLSGRDLQPTEEAPGSYVLDMGKLGETVRYVYAKNTSRIAYPYRWTVVNHGAIVKSPCSANAKVNFNIRPATGLLDKISETAFRVKCGLTDQIVDEQLTGQYRVTATMVIDGIPRESMTDRDVIFEQQDDNSAESVSVRIAEIEVISEYRGKERISLSVHPKVVDLNWYTLKTDVCVQETVDFVNSGSCPVYVSWISDVAGDLQQRRVTSATVDPESFVVAETARVRVRMEPRVPGRLRETLKFRAENRDGDTGETHVYVRGFVEQTPDVRFQPAAVEALQTVCTGTPVSYDAEFNVQSDRPFDVRRRLFDINVRPDTPYGVKSYGPYAPTGSSGRTTLNFQIPINTKEAGLSCQLAEWSLAGSRTVYTRAVALAKRPDVRLNVNAVTVAEPLYRGAAHRQTGIRLINNTNCDLIYSWGNPTGSDADRMRCAFEPSDGTVGGNSAVEFQFTVTPTTTCGHLNKYCVPCFVQCDDLGPQRISIECWVKDFTATIAYVDAFGVQRNIVCRNKYVDNGNLFQPDIPETGSGGGEGVSDECCSIWIENNDELLVGPGELDVSLWALATAWGRYQDTVSIVLSAGDDVLPAVHIPVVVHAVTHPVEFPISANVRRPAVKFSLYSNNSEHRLQIVNNSEIPVQVSWHIYNESEKKRNFGVLFDTSTPDASNRRWSLKIDRYYGMQFPRYFTMEPLVLKLEPKEQSYVTFFIDRTKEAYVNRNGDNMVYAKAVGTVTALRPSGKYCTREDGFKLKPTIVELSSETRHSIKPNLILREKDNVFRILASKMHYPVPAFHTTVTRLFTMINLLRYPATISFRADDPFTVKTLSSIRCGKRPGNSNICVCYEDLIKIELQASITLRHIRTPKMPVDLKSSRKHTQVGYLYAVCENGYYKPMTISPFEVHVYFPVLNLSPNSINFGRVVVRGTESIEVMLSTYPGPEYFFTIDSKYPAFTISPKNGLVSSHKPVSLTITFRPEADKRYSSKIGICTAIPMDCIYLDVLGIGTK